MEPFMRWYPKYSGLVPPSIQHFWKREAPVPIGQTVNFGFYCDFCGVSMKTCEDVAPNFGENRPDLYKRKKAPSPLCNCPENEEQTALHLLKDCGLFTKVRPPAFQTLTLPQIMQHHINTADVSSLINNIFRMLQEQSRSDQP
jgi:hypothetical protein